MDIRHLFMVVASCATAAVFADDFYVDCQMESYTGHDGSSWSKAYETIQEAINVAPGGSTIYVHPGVYRKGLAAQGISWGDSRIGWNNKRLTILSTAGAAQTIIEGVRNFDTANGGSATGAGTGAVRCLSVYNNDSSTYGSVVQGFTFRNGGTLLEKGTLSGESISGGGFYTTNKEFYFADCIFTECTCSGAGNIVHGGTFIRCRFTENMASAGATQFYGASGTALAEFFACVFDHNYNGSGYSASGGILIWNSVAVNCSFFDNIVNSLSFANNARFCNSILWNSGTRSATGVFENCVNEADDPRPVMSTIHADTRLLEGAAARTAGLATHLSALTIPDEVWTLVGNHDYGMNTLATTGVIAAGCNQTVTTPISGGLCVTATGTIVDGKVVRAASGSYAYPSSYPTQYVMKAVNADTTKRLRDFHFANHYAMSYDYRFPDRQDRLFFTPPPRPGVLITNNEANVSVVYYIQPDADASVADGSSDHPYRTIQAAIAARGSWRVYVARRGTYAEGKAGNATHGYARVNLDGVYRITSEEGPEVTIIKGDADETVDADEYGCGPNAVRCVMHTGNMNQLQGFTLTGGHAAATQSDLPGYGGAVYSNDGYLFVDDCIITNNVAPLGGASHKGRLTRCRIAENTGYNSIVLASTVCGCVLSDNQLVNSERGLIDGAARILHSTVVGMKTAGVYPWGTTSTLKRYASVFLAGDTAFAVGNGAGNIYWQMMDVKDAAGGTVTDPLLVNLTAGDYAPFSASPVYVTGVVPEDSNYGDDYWYYATTDYDGRPLVFPDGKPIAGAVQQKTDKSIVAIEAANGGLFPADARVEITAHGTLALRDAVSTRPCVGAKVNGVDRFFADEFPIVITDDEARGGATVVALYGNAWYVDADNGDDGNSGSHARSAKKTLSSALNPVCVLSGDVVYAAEGVYSNGTMTASDEAVPSRAVVPAGVELVATGARTRTVIEGKNATTIDPTSFSESDDMRGMGVGAVKCVRLLAGSRVKGFTLRGGNARGVESVAEDCRTGAGVAAYGTARNNCWAEDCLVTNCAAFRGGGAFGVKCLRCEFVDNVAVYGGGATSDSKLYGSSSHGNKAHRPYNLANFGHLWAYVADGCTVMDGFAMTGFPTDSPKIVNTILAGPVELGGLAAANALNCVINTNRITGLTPEWVSEATTVMFVPDLLSVGCTEEGRPIVGKSPAVDRGRVNLSDYELTDRDASGGQRIYNGVQDIGALEGDWRSRYASDLGGAWFTVTVASPDVVETENNTIKLMNATLLQADWFDKKPGEHRYLLTFRVVGSGMLTLTVNGRNQSFPPSEQAYSLEIVDGVEWNRLVARYTSDNSAGFAEMLGIKRHGSGIVLIVR